MGHVAITGGYVRRCRAFNIVATRAAIERMTQLFMDVAVDADDSDL